MPTNAQTTDTSPAAPVALYEFRAFDVDIDTVDKRLSSHATGSERIVSRETYIVTRLNVDAGCKIRDGHLELKELVCREGLLEKWRLLLRAPLPVTGAVVAETVGPLLGVDLDLPAAALIDEAALLQIAATTHQLGSVMLVKHRTRFELERGQCETVEIKLPGATLETAQVQSETAARALELMALAGIETRDNESYPARLQRLLFI